MAIETQESAGFGITALGAAATFLTNNWAEVIGAACALIMTLMAVLKYLEERPKRKADAELALLQVEEIKRAMENR